MFIIRTTAVKQITDKHPSNTPKTPHDILIEVLLLSLIDVASCFPTRTATVTASVLGGQRPSTFNA